MTTTTQGIRNFISSASLVLLMTVSGSVAANDDPNVVATETRQGLLKMVRMYFGPIYGMVRGQIDFNADVVAHNATQISHLTNMIPDAFRVNTAAADVQTEALDHIWDNKADFDSKAATVSERALALAAAAPEGLEAVQEGFGAMGGACKACHDEYRQQN